MEDVTELRKLAQIARELATTAFDFGARERFTAAAAEYEERARLSLDIHDAPDLVPATS
jgi:signal transduction histidine kinase